MTLDDVILMVLFVSCVSGLFGILALVADWLESKEKKMMELFKVSRLTGKPHTMTLPLTERVYGILYKQWKAENLMIQDVFYMLTPEQREFILTGTTPEEWASMFEEDEA